MLDAERRQDVGDLRRLVNQINVERVVRWKVVKAAFLVAFLSLAVAMFSLVSAYGVPGVFEGLLSKTNQSRYVNTRDSCLISNAANFAAKNYVTKSKFDPEAKLVMDKLIDLLRPYNADCTAYANEKVKEPR